MGAKGKTAQETIEKTTAFEVWYSNGRIFEKTRTVLSEGDPPVEVSAKTLYRWAVTYKWTERANDRDMLIRKELTAKAIAEKTAFLTRQMNAGRLLQQKGVAFLQDDKPKPIDPNDLSKGYAPAKGGIKSDFAAIQAVEKGLALERVGMQMPDQETHVKQEVVIRVVREHRKKPQPNPKDV